LTEFSFFRLVSKLGWFYTKLATSHSLPPADLDLKPSIDFGGGHDETTPLILGQGKTELESRVEQFQAM
jgi:hypothetical protein